MKIQYGKYTITTDKFQWILSTTETRKKTGVEFLRPCNYFPRTADMIEFLFEEALRKNDLEDLKKLKKHIDTAKHELEVLVRALKFPKPRKM